MDFSNMFNETTSRQIQKRKIPLTQLVENKHNVYKIVDIENLSQDIKEAGLLQPIVVKPLKNSDKYVIVIGHRRFNAYKQLAKEDPNTYGEIDCVVIDSKENEYLTLHKLHSSNLSVRKITKYEYLKIYQDYLEILDNIKKTGEDISGRTRSNIAKLMNVSENLINDLNFVLKNASSTQIEKCKNDDEDNYQFNLLLKSLRQTTQTKLNPKKKSQPTLDQQFNTYLIKLLNIAENQNNQEVIKLLEEVKELTKDGNN